MWWSCASCPSKDSRPRLLTSKQGNWRTASILLSSDTVEKSGIWNVDNFYGDSILQGIQQFSNNL